MPSINPEEARQYLARFRAAEAVERQELRETSIEIKFRQLISLMASAQVFAAPPDRELVEREVDDRWVQIRRAYGF